MGKTILSAFCFSSDERVDVEEESEEEREEIKDSPQKQISKEEKPVKEEEEVMPVIPEEAEASGFETLLKASEILSQREQDKKLAPSIPPSVAEAKEEDMDQEKEKPSFLVEHDYVLPPPTAEGNDSDGTMSADEDENTTPYEVFMDHNYCLPPQPHIKDLVEQQKPQVTDLVHELAKPTPAAEKKKKEPAVKKERKRKQPLKESTSFNVNDFLNRSKGSRELINLLPSPKPIKKFPPRKMEEERLVFFDMYSKGIDDEDIKYMKMTYEHLLESDDPMGYWVNDILWVDHPCTNIPDPVPSKKRKKNEMEFPKPHKTGILHFSLY